jgi:hypothetical protein
MVELKIKLTARNIDGTHNGTETLGLHNRRTWWLAPSGAVPTHYNC